VSYVVHVIGFHPTPGAAEHTMAIGEWFNVGLPVDAKILRVGPRRGGWALWFQCRVEEETNEPRALIVVGTGHKTEWGYSHVGSFEDPPGFFWHVFENENVQWEARCQRDYARLQAQLAPAPGGGGPGEAAGREER
jgi:hypothetical protein